MKKFDLYEALVKEGFEEGTTSLGYDKLTKNIDGNIAEAVFDKDHNGLNFFVGNVAKRYCNSKRTYNLIMKMI